MTSRDGSRERGIGFQQPAARCYPIRFVVEAFGKHLRQILDRRRPQQLRVDGGDAIRAVRADNGKVGHANLTLTAFLRQD